MDEELNRDLSFGSASDSVQVDLVDGRDSYETYEGVGVEGETRSSSKEGVGRSSLKEEREEILDVEEGVQENTLYFRDGVRRIDLVLAYVEKEEDEKGSEGIRRRKRQMFLENIKMEGLELEEEGKEDSNDGQTHFAKIHIPWEALRRFAEVNNIKLPFKEKDINLTKSPINLRLNQMFGYDRLKVPDPPQYYMAPYTRSREKEFLRISGPKTILSPAQRSKIVWQLLLRLKYDDTDMVGIRRLVSDDVFLAAYPLHEGRYDRDNPKGDNLDRRLLYLEWAHPSKWYKQQPIWLVRKYFGERIGMYFAWLGFYTAMLIPAAIVGLLVFVYGLASMGSKENVPSGEICDRNGAGNITMCPQCDKACSYLKLEKSCLYARMTYLFDNPATVFFAIFMSFWATTFLEMWKREQTILEWKWDLYDIEDDLEPRMEYEKRETKYRLNPVTGKQEPYVPKCSQILRYTTTGVMVLFMISVVVAALIGTIIYRITILSVLYSNGGSLVSQNAKLIASSTAACINLVFILILTVFYKILAEWMVNLENPRTHEEFENSYTFKMYIFQFTNYYSSLIYIAFFKGSFYTYPGDEKAREVGSIHQLRSDVCDPAGCLPELFIQLAIIMVGKQLLNNVMEFLLPTVMNYYRSRNQKEDSALKQRSYTRWEEDIKLVDAGRLKLFGEYLEMVLQYGFVTLFVAAFPLAPLFALLNNLGEIRLDAYNLITQERRHLGERVKDIGVWYTILKGVTLTAVVTNGFVIAFTSDFIPRLVYQLEYSPGKDLHGFTDWTLAEFLTSDYREDMGGDTSMPDPERCSYLGFRNSPDSLYKYDVNIMYWHVLAARLAFVVVFEHVVFALTGVIAVLIPDVPLRVKEQIQREKLLAKDAKYDHAQAASPSRMELD